jgi:hypothetical protein
MLAPPTKTIAVRFSEQEHSLIEGLARLRGVTTSDLVRELIGFERATDAPLRHLRLVPTKSERGGGPSARACLP